MPKQAKDKEEKTKQKKVSTAKKTTTKKTSAKKTAKKVATKKSSAKIASAKKPTTKKAATKKTTTKKATTKKTLAGSIVEYYDLPYRYDETVVKLLAQTPNTLFVYWDISDKDKQKYIEKYGEFFFNDSKPVLIIYNETLNYTFEVDINDYANSWYLHVNDSNCDYKVELGRKPINKYSRIENYLPITSSNDMGSPNDHILFDSLNNNIYFKNIKNNSIIKKDISLYFLNKIGKLYNIKDFYRTMYKDENIDFERLNLRNMPSS